MDRFESEQQKMNWAEHGYAAVAKYFTVWSWASKDCVLWTIEYLIRILDVKRI